MMSTLRATSGYITLLCGIVVSIGCDDPASVADTFASVDSGHDGPQGESSGSEAERVGPAQFPGHLLDGHDPLELGSGNYVETLSAANCLPYDESDDARLTRSNGAWGFASGQTGTASLICPIRAFAPAVENEYYTLYQAFLDYRDNDGAGNNERIELRFRYRKHDQSGVWTLSTILDSNDSAATGYNTVGEVGIPYTHHITDPYNIPHVLITMYRSGTQTSPVFSGARLWWFSALN
jgi:hypothetical protein